MFDLSNDLAAVGDGLETITLLRRGSAPGGAGTIITRALRQATTASEATIVNRSDVHKNVAGGGQYLATEVVWHLPAAELTEPPRLGDLILDGAGARWTILQVKWTTLGARWRCAARNVAVAFRLDDTIGVLKTAGLRGGCGPAENLWRTWKTGVRARIQPIDTIISSDPVAPSTTARYRIFVEEDLDLDHTCCIRGADGTIYRIISAVGAERIGEMQTIEVEVTR